MVSALIELIRSKKVPDNASMRFRKLRIAWSVGWGMVCLLLIVLWVRSYMGIDGHPSLRLAASQGRLYVNQSVSLQSVYVPNYSGQIYMTPHVGGFITFTPKGIRLQFLRPTWGIPYWAITNVMIIIGTTPWLPWRFSLRALLIGMTIFAVLLWLAIWAGR
jgi:hypothetical protein